MPNPPQYFLDYFYLLRINKELEVRLKNIQKAYNHFKEHTGQHQEDTENLCQKIEVALKNFKPWDKHETEKRKCI